MKASHGAAQDHRHRRRLQHGRRRRPPARLGRRSRSGTGRSWSSTTPTPSACSRRAARGRPSISASRRDDVEIQMGTLSKALGTYGAYLCASKRTVDYFINTCRTFIFNTGLPPAIAGAAIKSLEILSRRDRSCWPRSGETGRYSARRWRPGAAPICERRAPSCPSSRAADRKTMAVSAAALRAGPLRPGHQAALRPGRKRPAPADAHGDAHAGDGPRPPPAGIDETLEGGRD